MEINFQKIKFYNPTVGNLTFEGVVDEVINYFLSSPKSNFEIVVGCDSSSEDYPYFPVVLVVRKIGEGGRFFLYKMYYSKKFYNFHQRILQEVYLSCELALKFREEILKRIKKNNLKINYQFQYIHADVNENGQTRDMVKEVIGLIRSNGFEAKIKPESFAASSIADKFT